MDEKETQIIIRKKKALDPSRTKPLDSRIKQKLPTPKMHVLSSSIN
jgi:hypothetical protein